MQSHANSTESNKENLRPETAPEAPSGMVLTRYDECLYFAKSAYDKVKKALPLGADNNRFSPPVNHQETYHAIEMATRELYQHLSESLSPSKKNYRERFIQDVHCQANIYSNHKAGNCTAQAAVAFTYLWKCNVRPISHAMIGNLNLGIGHAFIIVGDYKNPHVAVVCDPYYNECYPLSQFNKHMASREFGHLCGNKIFISYTSDLSDHSDEIVKEFGKKIKLPVSVNKEIEALFTQKFLLACKKVKKLWADSPINTENNAAPIIVEPPLPLVVDVPKTHVETGYCLKR